MKQTILLLLALTIAATVTSQAWAGSIRIGLYSQNEGKAHATAVARITQHTTRPTHHQPGTVETGPTKQAQSPASGTGSSGSAVDEPPPLPTLPSDSPWLNSPHPRGGATFWYQQSDGTDCVYIADSSADCYRITGPDTTTPPTTVAPAALATTLADRLQLSPGAIQTSPRQEGLTGASSWFWLNPAPTQQSGVVTLGGERVTVTATPTIQWSFGDGSSEPGGPGVAYTDGPVPPGAIIHSYETRCLPGDSGHDPNILPSCATDGYSVSAAVTWQLTYQAAGPIAETGALTTRATTAEIPYPVSEARAFLTGDTA